MSDDSIKIEYEELNRNGGWDEYSMKSAEEPAPSFEHALDDLAPHVEQMCELTTNDHQVHPYTVRGVSFSYGGDHDVMGATITAERTLTNSNSPLILNTPHKIAEPYAEGSDETQVMTNDCLIDLERLQNEAEDYLEGKRAQMDMFNEGEESEPEPVMA